MPMIDDPDENPRTDLSASVEIKNDTLEAVVEPESESKVQLTEQHIGDLIQLQSLTAIRWFSRSTQLVQRAAESRRLKEFLSANEALATSISSACISQTCNYPLKGITPEIEATNLKVVKKWLRCTKLVQVESEHVVKKTLDLVWDTALQSGLTEIKIELVDHRCAGKRMLFDEVYTAAVEQLERLGYDARIDRKLERSKGEHKTILFVGWGSEKRFEANPVNNWYRTEMIANQHKLRESFGKTLETVDEGTHSTETPKEPNVQPTNQSQSAHSYK